MPSGSVPVFKSRPGSLSSSPERPSTAWVPEHGNFLPIQNSLVSNLCTSGPHWAETFSELRQSLRLLWPRLSSLTFTFTSVNLHCRLSLPKFAPSAFYLAQMSPSLYLCISNSTLVSAFRRTQAHRKNWVSVCVIYLRGGPTFEDLQSDHFSTCCHGSCTNVTQPALLFLFLIPLRLTVK